MKYRPRVVALGPIISKKAVAAERGKTSGENNCRATTGQAV